MQTKRPIQDNTQDASAYATAMFGEKAKTEDAAYDEGAPIYDRANSVIADNHSGGAGFFAEAHHTASLNIDGNYKGASVSADRLGSTAFGSPDIVLSNGEQFNPKFYETANGSYQAGAELIGGENGLAAKYAGQTILVPADQLAEVRELHEQSILDAMADGDAARAQALEAIQYDDHIHSGGIESQPLTYADAQMGADDIRHGTLPDYVGDDNGLSGTSVESAMLAASIAMASTIGPQLVSDAAKVLRGQISPEEAVARLQNNFDNERTRSTVAWASARGAGAAALTFMDAADPTGAAFLVNMVIDTIQLSIQLKNGNLQSGEFGDAMLEKAKDRAGYTALTAGAVWILGPVGLLVPIIVRRTVNDAKLENEAMRAWHGVADAMRVEFESRIKAASMLDAIGQHYLSADAAAASSSRASGSIGDDLAEIQKLLGYKPAPASGHGSSV